MPDWLQSKLIKKCKNALIEKIKIAIKVSNFFRFSFSHDVLIGKLRK